VALLAEALAYAKCSNTEAFFAKIMDGGGGEVFKLYPQGEAEQFVTSGEGGGHHEFFKRNLPHASGILEHLGSIKFSGLRSEGKVHVKTKGGGEEGVGELIVMDTVLPEASGVDLAKHGSDGHKVYSRVRFIGYDGRFYWVPFGW
jgi:hypothetical protein